MSVTVQHCPYDTLLTAVLLIFSNSFRSSNTTMLTLLNLFKFAFSIAGIEAQLCEIPFTLKTFFCE